MSTARAIPRNLWTSYLDDLTMERRGADVRITIDGDQLQAHDVLLEGLCYDVRDDVVEVSAMRPTPGRPIILRHLISRPRHVHVDSPAGIIPVELHVEDHEGRRTTVRLSPGAPLTS